MTESIGRRDISIIGGGLAGTLTAHYLVEQGVEPESIVIADASITSAGSKATGAIMHPFPAASMQPRPGLFETYSLSCQLLDRFGGGRIETFRRLPMFRPVGEDPEESRLYRSWKRHAEDFPDELNVNFVEREVCIGNTSFGRLKGLEYGPAYLVDLGQFVDSIQRDLGERGVLIQPAMVEKLYREDSAWRIIEKHPEVSGWESSEVVLAVGNRLFDWFPSAPIERRGGELLVSTPYTTSMDFLYNGGLHIAQKPSGRLVFGSSWWSVDELPGRNLSEILEEFSGRSRSSDQLSEHFQIQHVWRGVRCTSRDHVPLVGRLEHRENLYVIGALGGKGLLWAPLSAQRLAAQLSPGNTTKPIPPNMDVGRVERASWETHRIFLNKNLSGS